ncbi:TadE/TadG family type IV pilus assembly protein [Canibacter zhoujuaniae]|uniref:TadE/TadG family type IV pilus assembly protein n=1 Tax=Canibacter zhoujuaniae TaxID=2708343 RepID=UPI001421A719|nr:TadE family protein [Canibacter zhoujuaniae]
MSERVVKRAVSRCKSFIAADSGSVSVEFALILPAVVALLALAISGILIVSQQTTAIFVASQVARAEARGDTASIGAGIGDNFTVVSRSDEGIFHCVEVQGRGVAGPLSHILTTGKSCAVRSAE